MQTQPYYMELISDQVFCKRKMNAIRYGEYTALSMRRKFTKGQEKCVKKASQMSYADSFQNCKNYTETN